MRTVKIDRYGGPDEIYVTEVDKPTPADHEVLVKVKAAAVNPLDWHVMRGTPYFMRALTGILKPKQQFQTLGADVAGVVEELGGDVSNLKVGDAVFGDIFNYGYGALAEYVCVPEEALVLKPENINFEEAAGVPVAALTAYHGLNKFGKIKPGSEVLINGASGGVGTFAVQLAKYYGANVTGVCSTRNIDLVKDCGAEDVLDYTEQDIRSQNRKYDLIFDAVGNLSLSDYKSLLTENGNCAVVGFGGMSHLIGAGLLGGKRIKMVDFKANQKDLQVMADLLESHDISTVIDRTYSLDETVEAIRYLESSRARGKVIILL
ncbi:MAG: NAD(P)-dependent alcohol dehydrogenase [Reichenbachiella sp.]|uniref:NAD(P)-dependent alcohol dehydrogenase n=1 Tax=Reichenbachiella sp. TaxID=2184521 RepID=UPI002966BF93|nr:NAD(P)-dependent alcohol dehydrogenase [Reichenbachiella sp.]MDW3210666.1 NAD(P)-dependent alcohol dehydrogenase [Reichenbachiella sp.]